MIHKKTKIELIVTFIIVCLTINTYSQTNSEFLLYTKFDSIVGQENLGLNNGPVTLHPYKTIGDNNMFYKSKKYSIGTIVYDGQPYFNVKLKYDIFEDQLITNPSGQPEHIEITLIQDKIDSFSIYGKKFVRISRNQTSIPEFTTGFYEIQKIAQDFNLYIKHHKDILKEINEQFVYFSFHENYKYFIEYKGQFHKITNQNSIVRLFPENKANIISFYQKNRDLSKIDHTQFINRLMSSISDFSATNSKQ